MFPFKTSVIPIWEGVEFSSSSFFFSLHKTGSDYLFLYFNLDVIKKENANQMETSLFCDYFTLYSLLYISNMMVIPMQTNDNAQNSGPTPGYH